MIAKFFDNIFKLGDRYIKEMEREKDNSMMLLHRGRLEALHDVDDLLQDAWDKGEAMKTELFEVKPTKVEDIAILGIRGLRIFQDPNDGHIFYELENRHFDTEKEVITWVISEYNNKWLANRKDRPKSHFANNDYKGLMKRAKEIEWKKVKGGIYERKARPEVREV